MCTGSEPGSLWRRCTLPACIGLVAAAVLGCASPAAHDLAFDAAAPDPAQGASTAGATSADVAAAGNTATADSRIYIDPHELQRARRAARADRN